MYVPDQTWWFRMWSNQNTGRRSSMFPHPLFYLMLSEMKRKLLHDYHRSHVPHNVRSRHTQDAPINLLGGLAGQTQHTKQANIEQTSGAWGHECGFTIKPPSTMGFGKFSQQGQAMEVLFPYWPLFWATRHPAEQCLWQIKWLWEYPAPQANMRFKERKTY